MSDSRVYRRLAASDRQMEADGVTLWLLVLVVVVFVIALTFGDAQGAQALPPVV